MQSQVCTDSTSPCPGAPGASLILALIASHCSALHCISAAHTCCRQWSLVVKVMQCTRVAQASGANSRPSLQGFMKKGGRPVTWVGGGGMDAKCVAHTGCIRDASLVHLSN